jgi:hypothetical protein
MAMLCNSKLDFSTRENLVLFQKGELPPSFSKENATSLLGRRLGKAISRL